MISWGQLIGHIKAKRIEWAAEAVRATDISRPEFQYGVAVGRDQAIELILQEIQEMISQEEDGDA